MTPAIAASSNSRQLELGISDSDAPTVTEPYWDGLGISRARVVVPYDVATTGGAAGIRRRANFEAYRANAAAKDVDLLVVLAPSADVRAPGTRAPLAPSVDEFATAFAAFRERYPDIRTIAPWNEPNNRDARHYALGNDPHLAAEYWLRASAICAGADGDADGHADGGGKADDVHASDGSADRGSHADGDGATATANKVTLVAGSFAGIAGDDRYVDAYQHRLAEAGATPDVWAFHAHGDANAFQEHGSADARVTRYYLGKLQGRWAGARIWIDEIGARYRDAHGVVWGDASQARGTQFVLGLATLDPRIEAIYYFNYSNQCAQPSRCAVQDRGLVSPTPFNGEPPDYDATNRRRAAYDVIVARGPAIAPAAHRWWR